MNATITEEEAKEIVTRISKHLEDSTQNLFGETGGAEDALKHVEAARELAQLIPGAMGDYIQRFTEANQNFILGFIAMGGNNGDLSVALNHFQEARKIVRALKESYPTQTDNANFRMFAYGVEQKVIEVQIPSAEGERRNELEARGNEIGQLILKEMEPNSSMARFLNAMPDFQKGLVKFEESSRALNALDLEEATRFIAEANVLMKRTREALNPDDSIPFAMRKVIEMTRGYTYILRAREYYVRTLHDAVVGDVKAHHAADLKEADKELEEGMAAIESGAPFFKTMVGTLVDFPLDGLRQSVEFQRSLIRNLRHLVERGLSPKAIRQRTSPRFLFYFALTFLVVLFGSRLSGLVKDLTGTVMVNILLVSLVVSAVASFGYEVGLKFIEALKVQFGGGGKAKDSEAAA